MTETKRPRALIVDDDEMYLDIVSRMCRACGADVVTATTGEEARAAIAASSFDVVLLDLQLPRQEGVGLIADVEQSELASKAVVVTGFTMIAPMFTKLPIIDKGRLEDLAAHLRRVLER